MNLQEILTFEEYGGDMAYTYEALEKDIVEQIFDKLTSYASWKDKLAYLGDIGIDLDGSCTEDKFDELREKLLEEVIEEIQHACSYYPENSAYYDKRIEEARNNLEPK